MKKADEPYLYHILDAISKVEQYSEGVSYKKFLDDPLTQDGVIRQIEIIGEASKRLSDTIKQNQQEIPWKDMAGMRDKLIHDYFGVDLDAVWATIQNDIPVLKRQVKELLKENK